MNAFRAFDFDCANAVGKRIVHLTTSEEADFGIGCVENCGAEVQFQPLFTDWMSAVFPASRDLRRKKSVQLSELTAESLILTDPDSSVRHVVDQAFAAMGHAVVPVQEVTYMATALGMVKAGLGVAILPSSALELDQLRTLKALPIDHGQLKRLVGLIRKPNRSLSPAAASFLEELQEACNSTSGAVSA